MKKILSLFIQITKSGILKSIGKFIEVVIAAIFYVCLTISIILALVDAFHTRLYSFASRELLVSFEIVILMILLYLASQYKIRKSIYRVLWILTMIKIYFIVLMLPNIQKVMDFEKCSDTEYCKSFIRININQTDCLNSNGAWNIDDNACDYRYNLNGNCKKRAGNWVYPKICTE